MSRIYLIILMLVPVAWSQTALAQSPAAYKRAAVEAVQQKKYSAAVQYYSKYLKRKPNDPEACWGYAECLFHLHSYPYAEMQYKKIAETEHFPLLPLRLAEIRRLQGDYVGGATILKTYLAGKPADSLIGRARMLLDACIWAESQASDKPAVVETMGKAVNSAYNEMAPLAFGDTLLFSSYRFDTKKSSGKEKTRMVRLMLSVKGGRAREASMAWPGGGDSVHIAHSALTPDGNFLFFTQCKTLNDTETRCELWLAVRDRRHRWIQPQRLAAPINLPGYTTTQPSVAYDSVYNSSVLYFSSNRPGGRGGMDIWSVPLDTIFFCPCNRPVPNRKMPAPTFAKPENLVAVNTEQDEITPFFHTAGQTLYYSSNALPNFGGYDILAVKKQGKTFGQPKNMGPGINTSYNDLFFFLRPDGLNGYLASNRPGSMYLDENLKSCCNDLFSVRFPPPPRPMLKTDSVPLLSAKGLLKPPPPPPPLIRLKDFQGLPLYFDNDYPDPRSRRSTTQANYAETVQAYMERLPEYRNGFSGGLNEEEQQSAQTAVDSFFDAEVSRGFERLEAFSDLLAERLQQGEEITVRIRGFASPRAEKDYNLQLSRRRIASLRNYFALYNQGILASYLADGRLKIQEAPFGESTASSTISDNITDLRRSVYDPAAARERRVEIVEILVVSDEKKF